MMLKYLTLLLLIPSVCFGANYYVDPGAAAGGDGSFATPWNSISQVNAATFATGDGVYFRAGTTMITTATLEPSLHGEAGNRATFGAYHIVGGSPVIGLGGNARPVFDCQDWSFPTQNSYGSVIKNINRQGYLTIENLEIRRPGAVGIAVGASYQTNHAADYPHRNAYYIIRNVFVDHPWRQEHPVCIDPLCFHLWGIAVPSEVRDHALAGQKPTLGVNAARRTEASIV